MQADAYAGYNALAKPERQPAPVTLAGCWAHARRGLFRLAELGRAPLAVEAVRRIDCLFEVERTINGAVLRQQFSAPIVENLMEWMRDSCSRMSGKSPVAQAMAYILRRPDTFAAFLHDDRICLTNNAAERSLRGIAVGRKAWLFAGSDRGCHVFPDRHCETQ
ncbi:transposase [Komagataeibacter xylinus NBRC 15237]|nr:transposase [Komagataeibacter xylinus NBRC 15237]